MLYTLWVAAVCVELPYVSAHARELCFQTEALEISVTFAGQPDQGQAYALQSGPESHIKSASGRIGIAFGSEPWIKEG